MAIQPQLHAEIRRLYFITKMTVNAITDELQVHHSTVKRAIAFSSAEYQGIGWRKGQCIWDGAKEAIEAIYESYPRITTCRLLELLKEKDLDLGGIASLRYYVKTLPKRQVKRESFIKRTVVPGEEAQVDWGSFGSIDVDGHPRKLYAFVMVLSWSRYAYVEFTLDMKTETFLNCHSNAFKAFGGVPLRLLYDNLKSIVNQRRGQVVQFNAMAIKYADHFKFELVACNVRRGNEKGRVERRIRHIRDSFFTGRKLTNLETLNVEIKDWVVDTLGTLAHQSGELLTVGEAFKNEQGHLKPLPDFIPELKIELKTKAHKYALIRFENNRYTIPPGYTSENLTVYVTHQSLTIVHNQKTIAVHKRYWGKNKEIEIREHIEALKAQKKKGIEMLTRNHLLSNTPLMQDMMNVLVKQGYCLSQSLKRFEELRIEFGQCTLSEAIRIGLTRDRSTPEAIRHIITSVLHAKGLRYRPHGPLKDEVKNLEVSHHSLSSYDDL